MNNVTVLIPSYNHGRFLVYQIDSLLAQTLVPERIVVVDDGSTDETSGLLRKYEGNDAITVIRQSKNAGVHAAMDLLMNHVKTEFFAFAAADDLLTRNWCETMSSLLKQYPEAKMAISNSFIWESGKVLITDSVSPLRGRLEGVYFPGDFISRLLKNGRIPPSNPVMYRSDMLEEVIRPVTSRADLLNLIDILTIIAIGTKYPVAFSTKPHGIWIKRSEGYGSSNLRPDQLGIALRNIEKFSVEQGYILYPQVTSFLMQYAKYTWAKQKYFARSEICQASRGKWNMFFHKIYNYAALLTSFVLNRRYRFVQYGGSRCENAHQILKAAIDARFLNRLNSE